MAEDVVLSFGADTSKLNSASTAGINKKLDKIKSKIGGLKGGFGGLAAAAGAFGAVLGVGKLLASADALAKHANAAGIGIEEYQRLTFGLEQAGISTKGFEKALLKSSKAINEAKDGVATYTDAFDAIGLSMEELEGLSPDQTFIKILDAVNQIEDPIKRSALAQELLGKEFAQAAVDVDAMVEAGKGIVPISPEVAKRAEAMNDAMNRIKTTIGNLTANVLIPMVAALEPVVEAFSEFAQEHPTLTKLGLALTAVGIAIVVMGGPITAILASVALVVAIFTKWDDITAFFKEKWDAFGQSFPVTAKIIELAIDAFLLPIRLVIAAWKQMSSLFSSDDSALTGIVEEFDTWGDEFDNDNVQDSFDEIKDSMESVEGGEQTMEQVREGIVNNLAIMAQEGGEEAKSFADKFLAEMERAADEAVVHSIVPDMVTDIAVEMSKLAGIGAEAGKSFSDGLNENLSKGSSEASSIVSSLTSALSGSIKSGSFSGFGASLLGGIGGDAASIATSSILSLIGLHGGGKVSGAGSGTSDSIPALLSNGEFVMNAKATKRNLSLLKAMNNNKFSKGGMAGKYASGGLVDDGLNFGSGQTVNISGLSFNIDRDTDLDDLNEEFENKFGFSFKPREEIYT